MKPDATSPRGTRSMPLFHWRDEGEPVRQGLNLYPLQSQHHVGGYLVIGALRLYARWSKIFRRLHLSASWVEGEKRRLPRSQWPAA